MNKIYQVINIKRFKRNINLSNNKLIKSNNQLIHNQNISHIFHLCDQLIFFFTAN